MGVMTHPTLGCKPGDLNRGGRCGIARMNSQPEGTPKLGEISRYTVRRARFRKSSRRLRPQGPNDSLRRIHR